MRKNITLAAAIVALAPFALSAQTDGYYDRSYVRMSYVQGDVYVQRSGDLGYQAGEVNLVVIAGDKIGTRAGRLELQLGRQNYLRLDNDTVVEMAALPGADAQPTKIHLLSGSIFVRVNSLDGARNFEVHSPDASFYLLAEGLYRLDVREGRETALRVVEGEAEASGEQGSIVARAGESLAVSDGQFVADGSLPAAPGDDFRSWNDSRDAQFARPVQQSYLPAEYSEYETELADNGRWAYESDYGNVWVPRVDLCRLAAVFLRPLDLVSDHRLDLGFLRALGLVHLALRPLGLGRRPGLVLDPPSAIGAGARPGSTGTGIPITSGGRP